MKLYAAVAKLLEAVDESSYSCGIILKVTEMFGANQDTEAALELDNFAYEIHEDIDRYNGYARDAHVVNDVPEQEYYSRLVERITAVLEPLNVLRDLVKKEIEEG